MMRQEKWNIGYQDGEPDEPEYSVYRTLYGRLPHGNLWEALEYSSKHFPDKYAVIDNWESLTYRELIQRTCCLAGYLMDSCGIHKGSRVGLLFVNEADFVISFYALVKLGAVAVMVNTKLQPPEIRHILEDTDTKLLIMNGRWWDKVKDFVTQIGIGRVIFDKPQPEELDMTSSIYLCELWKEKGYEGGREISEGGWQTAAIMHTSGTTGTPKGVMISHRNILETAYGYQEVQGLVPEDVAVLSVPIFHILGLSCVTTNFLTLGGTVVLTDFYSPAAILEKITRYHGTHFHSVPTVFLQIMEEYGKAQGKAYDLSSLRIAVCGGAFISEANIDEFCRIVPSTSFRLAYGMTETAGGGTLSPGHRLPLKPAPNVELAVVDEQGRPQPSGQAVFKGPVVVRQFWGGRQVKDGHLESGDLVRKDNWGYVYVTDRLKDIISRGGEKIFPSVIETVIKEYTGVVEAAVFAVSDPLYGELPAAVITQDPKCPVDTEELYRHLKTRIAKYELPCRILVWEELPRTANGKIKKAILKEFFEKERIST